MLGNAYKGLMAFIRVKKDSASSDKVASEGGCKRRRKFLDVNSKKFSRKC